MTRVRLVPILDDAMDRLVVPGYSRAGYAVRRRIWADDPAPDALQGKHVLVTGANSGLGKATVAGLARLGATVHMLVRNQERGDAARGEVLADVPGADLLVERCDVSSLAAVRSYAEDFAARGLPVHGLVHNAGVLSADRQVTDEGHELTFATNVLGPFLLTALLADRLRAGAPSRVVWVSSGGMYTQRLPADDLEYERGEYKGATAYARTKRMQVVLAEEWARALRGDGVTVHSMHPGWVDTPGIAASLPRFYRLTKPLLRTPAEGADTIVWLCAADAPAAHSGGFWQDRRRRPTRYTPGFPEIPADRQYLWRTCERLTGVA